MIKIVLHFSIRVYWNGRRACRVPDQRTADRKSFKTAAEEAIAMLSSQKGVSTISNYWTALRSFMMFAGHDIETQDISLQRIASWQQWLKERNTTLNTISCYMRYCVSL